MMLVLRVFNGEGSTINVDGGSLMYNVFLSGYGNSSARRYWRLHERTPRCNGSGDFEDGKELPLVYRK